MDNFAENLNLGKRFRPSLFTAIQVQVYVNFQKLICLCSLTCMCFDLSTFSNLYQFCKTELSIIYSIIGTELLLMAHNRL